MCVIHRILRLCATTALLAEVSMIIKNFFCTYYVLHSNSILLLIASVVSNSVRPHRRQPTRLPRPWDSPGGNTDSKTLNYKRTNPAVAAAKSLQLCPTLCDPKDGSPPGSPIPGILQARTLEWVAISFSNA